MSRNVGTIERWARVLVGAVLIAIVFVGPHSPWGWLGLIPLGTGISGYCPLYALFGWTTVHPHTQSPG